MRTIVGVGDPKAVQRYSAFLAVDVGRESYFNRKFMGTGVDAQTPLQTLPQLENDVGDTISYDLVMQLKMAPVEGDDVLEGKEEALKFYTDKVSIDQARGGVDTGGRMTRKRTIHDMRAIARKRQGEWWARLFDELFFMYLGGGRGINPDFILPTTYTGFAGNPFVAPDSMHQLFQSLSNGSGAAVSAASQIDNTCNMSLTLIDRAVTRASTMGGGTSGIPSLQPVRIDGEEHYVCVMHPFQEHSIRTNAGSGQWLDIQKAAATALGSKSPIFTGALGMYRNVVLHSHRGVIRFGNYGSGANLPAARSMFMGRQAGVVAFGSPGNNLRFDWHEDTRDNGNAVVISTSSIFGAKKTSFTIDGVARDFGMLSLDTYAADPS